MLNTYITINLAIIIWTLIMILLMLLVLKVFVPVFNFGINVIEWANTIKGIMISWLTGEVFPLPLLLVWKTSVGKFIVEAFNIADASFLDILYVMIIIFIFSVYCALFIFLEMLVSPALLNKALGYTKSFKQFLFKQED